MVAGFKFCSANVSHLSMNAAVVIVSGLDSSAEVISFNSFALAVALSFE
jgi:hypothetical protein